MGKTKGMLIASAAATLILSGAVVARADSHEKTGGNVSCTGVNACKGQGSCSGAGNSCAGQNSCKGKGVLEMSKDECLKKGGKVVEDKK